MAVTMAVTDTLQERSRRRGLLRRRDQQPCQARRSMLLLPVMSIRLQSQGMDMVSVRSRAIMRLRPELLTIMRLRPELLTTIRLRPELLTTIRLRHVSPATTSLAMRTTGRGRLFRCGVSVHSVRGNGSSRSG
jgi:hypothetical protein